ncbi:MEKHLA domain-containing protein [Listeria weihenstephanensis]|uniref:MEKHLA domain-containing protein n=1 Tax=Listeria weihenstephanensis TaxID=1006155 RepID=A0A841Z9G3_9LIST|nr:MEKHLA domain-containing protein [Listeria weihenstephanensis]MBC1501232.1 MEKHLA domain-containing protein [Listeria weihenstephanensis]
MYEDERYQMLRLIEQSYEHWTRKKLPTPSIMEEERLRWLDEQSPYGLLVQNNNEEPLFIYANKQAQIIFGYSLEEFLSTPSRKSAPPQMQRDRECLLEKVTTQGILMGYHGTRVDKQGMLFEIKNGMIWNLISKSGETIGMAALICKSET